MNDLRTRMTLRRRWRRLRQRPDFQHQAVRTAQLTALSVLLVITAVLVYRAMTTV
ncbi:hypothetical protein GHK92_19665 [Nocardioides sp. dk4132]|uniref:hypothetical protein n=1 Tax=unclassified Nocardioides TaxID=2615069 RepID=UPI001295F283|nr:MULTISPECIES: hypothetical protein [unclassified Nocardioides]MQW78090.1 hypothetical protein [Nocardioides sp. dk4132]